MNSADRRINMKSNNFLTSLTIFLFVTIGFVVASLFGCATLRENNLVDDFEKVSDTVTTVCKTAQLFEIAEVESPVPEICEKVLPVQQKFIGPEEIRAVSGVVYCVKHHNVKSEEFINCVIGVEQWPQVARKISKVALK
jgi:hypothetical protein